MAAFPQKFLVVVAGPTAVGKTTLVRDLALKYDTEVVYADSRQVYREMSIGTAKPSKAETEPVPHHLIGHRTIHQHYSAAEYAREAEQILENLFLKHDLVFLSGGSGLYIDGLIKGFDDLPEVPAALRTEINNSFEKNGLQWLQDEVQRQDPHYFESVDQQNHARLKRALEIIRVGGKPYSAWTNKTSKELPYKVVSICLDRDRSELHDRINLRVDRMMEGGLMEEVRALHPQRELKALQSVGYSELFDYLEGLHTLEVAVELIKRNTRRYAKRQLTWFRRGGSYCFLPPDLAMVDAEIMKQIQA